MIESCSLPGGPPSLARDVLASTDCFIADRVEQAYAQLLAPGGAFAGALTAALTIYVALYGYRLVLGRSSLSVAELLPHFVKIGLVLALVTSWPSYQRLAFRLFFTGPQEIAGAVITRSANGGPDEIIVQLQLLFDSMTEFAGDAWSQRSGPDLDSPAIEASSPFSRPATPDPGPAAMNAPEAPTQSRVPNAPAVAVPTAMPFSLGAAQFVAISLWGSALLMLASSVGLLLVVKIILALLLAFGPVFIGLALFGATRGLFEGWLKAVVKFALVPLIVLPLSGVLVIVLGRFVGTLEPGDIEAFRDTPALSILVIIVVFAIVLGQALSLTGLIAGSIRLPRTISSKRPSASGATVVPIAASAAGVTRVEAIVSQISPPATTLDASLVTRSFSRLEDRQGLSSTSAAVDTADVSSRLGQAFQRNVKRNGFVTDMRSADR